MEEPGFEITLEDLEKNKFNTTRLGLFLQHSFNETDWENGELKPIAVFNVLIESYVKKKMGGCIG